MPNEIQNTAGAIRSPNPITGMAINAGSNFLSDVWNTIFQKRLAKQQFDQNKKMADYQYNKELEMWNRQNAYNTPEMQQQRLADAGLNKAMMYGQGTVGNTQGGLPQYQAPRMDYGRVPSPRLPEMISTYQDIAMKNANIDLMAEQVKNAKAENLIKLATAKKLGVDTSMAEIELGIMSTPTITMTDSNGQTQESPGYRRLAQYTREYKKAMMDMDLKRLNQGYNLGVKELEIKGYDIERLMKEKEWRDKGITPGDKVYFRLLIELLSRMGINIDDL